MTSSLRDEVPPAPRKRRSLVNKLTREIHRMSTSSRGYEKVTNDDGGGLKSPNFRWPHLLTFPKEIHLMSINKATSNLQRPDY